ncbi:MAG: hypothetical protein LLG06_09510, partial [Desulfobacteraceae bacterium]|nr:hypothetical protein [Desulfobacteraceae bacterium]
KACNHLVNKNALRVVVNYPPRTVVIFMRRTCPQRSFHPGKINGWKADPFRQKPRTTGPG